ncbi:ATP-binding protein [Sporosarcina sp. FSL W7-1349]|uniref:ATP-binding protein n=1 Tax=Sporosarcina sp. FSL W7-1349 TaxID=2921561 RepID=UPI0030FCE7CC
MNRIWNSIVGKLWATILLLVSFVLFIVTVLLLEFLSNFHAKQAEDSLWREASTIAKIVVDHDSESSMQMIIHDILDDEKSAMIVSPSGELKYSFHSGLNTEPIEKKILEDRTLYSLDEEVKEPVLKEMILPSNSETNVMEQYFVLGFPFEDGQDQVGSVIIYQNMDAVHRTTQRTTHIVLLSALIAFVLTTFFAFFLSTRITSPLRGLRQAAGELAKGNFDTRIPVFQNDEIGQLATAFNQMGRQLKYHVELINQEKEQLSSILTSMTDAVITFNRDATILLRNPQAERMLQNWYAKNDKMDDTIPPEVVHMLDHVVTFAEEVEDELELGGRFYMISLSPLYSGDSIRGAVVVFRDMTEQHKLDKLRSDFIANVSHELRTPISMLQGYSEAILDDVIANEEERNEMIQIIHDESMRMGRLVTDLLDLARMESGNMRLYEEDVPMIPFLGRVLHKFSQIARDAHVELTFQYPEEDDIILHVDADRLEQVFTNLIDNAVRHTPEGGNVDLGIAKKTDAVEITVSDTGIGIPEEDLPFIFERFYKADKARTRKKGGTGLGLAIAKNIIDSHGGAISARRGDEKGTVFTCRLPLKRM